MNMAQQTSGPGNDNNNLKRLLEDLGSASDDARLQLHLLALQTRQRTGELGTRLDQLERELDRGLHQSLATATERARQLSRAMQASLGLDSGARPAAKRSGRLRVRSIMTEPVQTCSPEDSLHRAAQVLWDTDCGALPVVGSDGRVQGVLTDRDICMAAFTTGLALGQIQVAGIMSRPAHCCRADDTLERAIALMAEAEVRRVPVIEDDQRLVGIVSLADVALHASLLGRKEAEALLLRLLGALSKPRRKAGESLGVY
jgi:CBS domain-containing protein